MVSLACDILMPHPVSMKPYKFLNRIFVVFVTNRYFPMPSNKYKKRFEFILSLPKLWMLKMSVSERSYNLWQTTPSKYKICCILHKATSLNIDTVPSKHSKCCILYQVSQAMLYIVPSQPRSFAK